MKINYLKKGRWKHDGVNSVFPTALNTIVHPENNSMDNNDSGICKEVSLDWLSMSGLDAMWSDF